MQQNLTIQYPEHNLGTYVSIEPEKLTFESM